MQLLDDDLPVDPRRSRRRPADRSRSLRGAPSSSPGEGWSRLPAWWATPASSASSTWSSLTSEHVGQLGDRRRAPQPVGQVLLGPPQLEVQLLGPARRPHRPGAVPEVALQLALDRAAGEGRERHPDLGVEALDRVDDGQQGDLAQVVGGDPTPRVARHEVLGDVQVVLDELVAQPTVAGAAVLGEALRAPAALGGRRRAHGTAVTSLRFTRRKAPRRRPARARSRRRSSTAARGPPGAARARAPRAGRSPRPRCSPRRGGR